MLNGGYLAEFWCMKVEVNTNNNSTNNLCFSTV